MEKIILVHYIDVGNMSNRDAKEYLVRYIDKMPKDNNIINYFIPTKGENKIDCLNPKLVSEDEFNHVKGILDRNQKFVDDIMNWKNI